MKKNNSKRIVMILLVITIVFTLVITIVNFVLFKSRVGDSEAKNEGNMNIYKYHFGLVCDNYSQGKWQEIYEAANEYAKNNDAYVELVGDSLKQNYSKEDLFRIAMLSGVDGIIVEGDNSDELNILINEACENGIPVVTVMTDSSSSKRNSFVGIGSYDVGRQLGSQMLKLSEKRDETSVMVLMNSGYDYQEQHTMYQAIAESISADDSITFDTWLVRNANEFGIDEEVRDIILNMQEEPDIMVCLSDRITESVYQQVVEYNKVESIDIIGIASSNMVFDAVNKQLIDCVITFDKKMMGVKTVDALLEYKNNGYVSEYYMVDTTLVSSSNARRYIDHEEE